MDALYLQQTVNNLDRQLALACAEIYCRIWKEPPWNEDFWNPSDVLDSLRQQLSEPLSVCWLALSPKKQVIGFSWGYGVSRDAMRKISGNDQLDRFFDSDKPIFYISELGVDPDQRLKGVGRTLTDKLIAHSKDQECERIMLRTDVRAIPARALYSNLGFIELANRDSAHKMRTYWTTEI